MGLSIRLLASVSRAPEALDAAVASPYGWTTDISRPLALNGSERATKRRGPGAARVVLWIPDQEVVNNEVIMTSGWTVSRGL